MKTSLLLLTLTLMTTTASVSKAAAFRCPLSREVGIQSVVFTTEADGKGSIQYELNSGLTLSAQPCRSQEMASESTRSLLFLCEGPVRLKPNLWTSILVQESLAQQSPVGVVSLKIYDQDREMRDFGKGGPSAPCVRLSP